MKHNSLELTGLWIVFFKNSVIYERSGESRVARRQPGGQKEKQKPRKQKLTLH